MTRGLLMKLNILCIGDIVGRPGRRVLADKLRGPDHRSGPSTASSPTPRTPRAAPA